MAAVLALADSSLRKYVVATASRSLNRHEALYDNYMGKMLAVVWACNSLRGYLRDVHFTIVADHQPQVWLMTSQKLCGQYYRSGDASSYGTVRFDDPTARLTPNTTWLPVTDTTAEARMQGALPRLLLLR